MQPLSPPACVCCSSVCQLKLLLWFEIPVSVYYFFIFLFLLGIRFSLHYGGIDSKWSPAHEGVFMQLCRIYWCLRICKAFVAKFALKLILNLLPLWWSKVFPVSLSEERAQRNFHREFLEETIWLHSPTIVTNNSRHDFLAFSPERGEWTSLQKWSGAG